MGHFSWSTKKRGLFFQMQSQTKMYKDHNNKKRKKNSNQSPERNPKEMKAMNYLKKKLKTLQNSVTTEFEPGTLCMIKRKTLAR